MGRALEGVFRSALQEAERRRPTVAYLVAVLSTVLMFFLRRGVEPAMGDRGPLLFFVLSCTIAAWLGGLGPGLCATLLGALLGWYAFLEPSRDVSSAHAHHLAHGLSFIAVCVAISLACERMHRAAEHARSKLAELQALYDMAPGGMCALDAELRWVRINQRLAEMNGVAVADHLGRAVYELLPDAARQTEAIFRRILATGETVRDTEIIGWKTTSGAHRTWLMSCAPLRDMCGKVVGISVMCNEITERKRMEEALAASAAAAERNLVQLQTVISGIHEGVAIVEPDGRLLQMNPAARGTFGTIDEGDVHVRRAEFEVRTLDGVLLSMEERPLARLVRGERVEGMVLRVRLRAADHERVIAFNGGPVIDHEGQHVASVITFQDVTEQKRAEAEREALLASERAARAAAERANRVKDEFLAVLSHELRTPLNAILGWASLLRRSQRGVAAIDKGLEVIERNAHLQVRLISDLLDVSGMLSGKIQLEVKPVALGGIVAGALDALRSAAAERRITLRESIAAPCAVVRGDPAKIHQILTNLLSNAIKFTKPGGCVEASLNARDGRVEIAVRDNGQGIPPEFLPHVFERFRQADASTTRHHGGLGLGLSIVKHLVELHGGAVRAESDGPDRGAVFTITLPSEAATPAADAAHDGAMNLRGVRVLVVEDDDDARDLVQRLLEESEATVVATAAAEDALMRLTVDPPDVLVSDISMPGMDGYQLIQAVHAQAAHARVPPAVALTAFARAEDRDRVLSAGYEAHLAKPVDGSKLVATVARLSRRSEREARPDGSRC